jgi:hypothetical protein
MWGRGLALAAVSLALAGVASAHLSLGPEEFVESGGVDIDVVGYSVPCLVDWNDDDLPDLLVGDGLAAGRVRVYLNVGTETAPSFDGYFYAQADTGDLTEPGSGCLAIFPRVVYWDADGKKDMITGRSDGRVRLFTNIASDDAPAFDAGVFLQVGAPGSKVDIDVGYRATPVVVDWNSDGRKDLVVGERYGKIYVFLNEGTDDAPDFLTSLLVQEDGVDLVVPTQRSSPHIEDFDHDGKKDIVTGNTEGQILCYNNVGTDQAPVFSGYTPVEADGVPIDLGGTSRSRPFVCEWNHDGFRDLLIGYGDGLVRIYTGVEHYHDAGAPEDAPGRAVALLAPHPNPSSGRAVLAFDLPWGQAVRIDVHDVSGRRVATAVDRWYEPGRHEVTWSGLDDRGRRLPSGVYLIRLEALEGSDERKIVLMR